MKKEDEYDFYTKISDWDFDMFDIVTEELTNWDLYKILENETDKDSVILDLGTGGGEKVLQFFPKNVKEIIATDYSEGMINTAKKNLEIDVRKNITFKVMDNLKLNFPKNYFDVVVARHTIIDPMQIHKILKKGGVLLVRGVDKYDCHELKRIFGKGQGTKDVTPISVVDYENILDAGFNDVELVPLHEREFYKNKETLYRFLLKVPILDDFSEENNNVDDYYKKGINEEKLDKYISRNTTSKGIVLTRRYYGIYAKK